MSSSSAISMLHAAISAIITRGKHSYERHRLPARSFPAPTPFGTLIVIPVEIRLKVYRLLIARGQLAILRTSRAINEEASDNLYKHAVCRLGYNYNLPFMFYLNQMPWHSIQTLELRAHITYNYSTFNRWLQRFSPYMTNLKECRIRVDYPYNSMFLFETFEAIRTLTAFPKITFAVAVDPEPYTIAYMGAFTNVPQPDPDRDMYLDMHCKVDEDVMTGYEWAVGVFEPTLGSAVWFEDEKGMHLEFHPQQSAVLVKLNNKDDKTEEHDNEQSSYSLDQPSHSTT